MRVSRLPAVVLAVLLVAGCTSGAPSADDDSGDGTPTGAGAPEATTPPSSTPSPTPTAATLGAGSVTIEGTEIPVSGDCDISKDFGQAPVTGLGDDALDVLLAVDNITGSGAAAGGEPMTVRLLGSGAVEGRTLTSVTRGDDGADVTWEGTVTSASLRDRASREFLDVATLHLEATQRPVGPGSGSRDVVVDVTCAISRPG